MRFLAWAGGDNLTSAAGFTAALENGIQKGAGCEGLYYQEMAAILCRPEDLAKVARDTYCLRLPNQI